jgi:hypothetical protein
VEEEIAWIRLASRVDDKAVLVTVKLGEIPRVVVFEDAHGLLPQPRRGVTMLTSAFAARRRPG